MMKSFFKKLSLVMALAMVVSAIAPAATASAAEALGIVAQNDTTWTVLETDVVEEIGADVVDYMYKNAPANYKELDPTWDSSDKTVATVDKYGKVTTLKEGTTTISITLSNGQEGKVVLTVDTPEEALTCEYDQVSHKVATFTFNKDVNFKVEDVTLTKVFQGGYEVNWPIESFKCEGKVVTIAPYVAFADGDQYVIKFGADDAEGTPFTTVLGAVDEIEVAFKSLDKAGKAYAKLEEEDEDIEVTLSCKLFSNGVEVTEAPGYSLENIEFELVEESDDFDLDENILIFEKPGVVAMVKAIYTYEVNGEEKTKDAVAPVVSEPAPKYTIVSVDNWTVAQRNNANVKIDWAGSLTHSIPAFDENNSSIVVLMTDSYGNKIVFPDEFKDNSKLGDKTILSLNDITNDNSDAYIEAAEDFEIRFTSTNTSKIFVGTETGDITTLGTSKAPILVSLYDENNDGDMVLVKNMYAAGLEVTDQRRADDLAVNVEFDELLADIYNKVDAAYETGKVTFTVKDQYGKAVSGAKVKITEANDNISVTVTSGTTNNDGKVSITLNGSDFYYYSSSKDRNVAVDSVKFTAQVVDTNVKETFVVKTETPEIKNVDGVITLTVEDYNVSAGNVDQKIAKKADGTTKTTAIKLYQTSNGMNVGIEGTTQLLTKGSTLLKNTEGEFSIKSGDAVKDAMYIVVYGPDGKALSQASTASALGVYQVAGGDYSVCVATASGSSMTYLAAGTYTVKAYQVTKVYDDADKNAKVEDFVTTFTVSNTSDKVTLKEQKHIDLSDTANDLEDVIFDAFNYNLGSGTLDENYAKITGVEYKYNADSNYVFIYNVTFDVPLNNGADDVYYTSGKVAVNKAVQVNANFSETY